MPGPTPPAKPKRARVQRTPARAVGRSLGDFAPLSRAENTLLECYRCGEIAAIASDRPREPDAKNAVRAAFVRFLALGGDESAPSHEHGIALCGAWIEGPLDLEGAEVEQRILLKDCAIEQIKIRHCRLKFLGLPGCLVRDGIAGDSCRCEAQMNLRDGFHAKAPVRLIGAILGGLDCGGGFFEGGGGGALLCDGAQIAGTVHLGDGFHAVGQVRFTGARIDGILDCCGGKFENPGGEALSLDNAMISGSAMLRDGFQARGEVRLVRARVGSNLECRDGRFENPDGEALLLDGASIEGSVFLTDTFTAVGKVSLIGAKIEANLRCSGGRFDGHGQEAIYGDDVEIGESAFLDTGLTAIGEVRLLGATIGGDLACIRCSFENPGGDAFSCDGARVRGGFYFLSVEKIVGAVRLPLTHVGFLCDDLESWLAAKGQLVLDGFTYDRLTGGAPTDAAPRIRWLEAQIHVHLHEGFRSQPWEQLIATLRAMGHPNEARTVAIAKHRQMRQAGRFVGNSRILDWLYGAILGYGYRPTRLLASIAATWLFCGTAYWLAANPAWFGSDTHLIAPVAREQSNGCLDQRAAAARTDPCPALPADYQNFVPFVYSADVLLPVLSLGYKEKWQPVVRDGNGNPILLGQLLRFLYWFEIAFGWLAGLQLVGLFGNLIKKD